MGSNSYNIQVTIFSAVGFKPPNVSFVKNDVMLALAAGAEAVRLFQGGSWVNGWIGPPHDYSGLNDLLQACRTGGEGSYTHTGLFDMAYVGSSIGDIIIDFFKW